jgi:hypothetical protein
MRSFVYSNKGSMAAMIAELVCVISLSGEPNAEYALLAAAGQLR